MSHKRWPDGKTEFTYAFVDGSGPHDRDPDREQNADENREYWLETAPFDQDDGDGTPFRQAARDAMEAWEAVCGVSFREVAGDDSSADILIGQVHGTGPNDASYSRVWETEEGGTDYAAIGVWEHFLGFEPSTADTTAVFNVVLAGLNTILDVTPIGTIGGLPYPDTAIREEISAEDAARAAALYGPATGAGPGPGDEDGSSGLNVIIGTPLFDRLYGTPGNDIMTGGGGRDLLAGGDGDDWLLGGSDGATLFGQDGADTFVYTGGRNWFMDYDTSEGDRIAGLDQAYIDQHGETIQIGEHFGIYFNGTPWGESPNVIWFGKDYTGGEEGLLFA